MCRDDCTGTLSATGECVLQLQNQPHLRGRLEAKAASDGLEVQRVHVEDLLELVGVIGQDVGPGGWRMDIAWVTVALAEA